MSVQVPASIQIQLVLFEMDLATLLQTLRGLGASVRRAKSLGSLSTANLTIGDCSPTQSFDHETQQSIETSCASWGFDATSYSFFDENLGSAGGSNRLAAGATADFLLVMNPDTYPSPDLLHELVSAYDSGIGIVEARQLPVEHPKAFAESGDVSWASGACSLILREAFEAVGGYDTDHFFLHCDDVDLSWRLRYNGFRVIHAPAATLLHHKPLTHTASVVAPVIEQYHGALGRLMLASRYDRPDIIDQTLESIAAQSSTPRLEAAAEFLKRKHDGRLPEPLPDAARVATFVNHEYAEHRF